MGSEPRKPDFETAGIAHDANQMLAVIAGRVGLLLSRDPDEDTRRHLKAIATACADAGAILGRLQGRGHAPGAGVCVPGEEIRTALEVVRPAGGSADWKAAVDPSQPGLWSCRVDVVEDLQVAVPGQVLREVLANLLTNALEAMPVGGGVTISAEGRGDRVLLTVRDTGPGIPPEAVAAVFEVGTSTKAGSSRGIGLAGCRRLLMAHDARLALGDSDGSGAALVLDLPLSGEELRRESRNETAPMDSPLPDSPLEARILVVDDEETVRDMLAEVLGELGFRVTVVPDATAALAGFQKGAFHIALLDQTLPGMSGAELAKRLRASDPCLSVFLMTGWGNEEILGGTDPLTVDFTARKPMEFDRLRQLLDEAAALHARRLEEHS